MNTNEKLKEITAVEAKDLYVKQEGFYVISDAPWRVFLRSDFFKKIKDYPKYITFERMMDRIYRVHGDIDIKFYIENK